MIEQSGEYLETFTTDEIAQKLAGGDSYIRTKNKEVKGLAITTDLNPEAPEVIVVGTGPRIKENARLYLESKIYVPVYIKQSVNKWKYMGEYKAVSYAQDSETIEKHRATRPKNSVDGILFLSSKDDIMISISGAIFPNETQRKKIEVAAIKQVISYYEREGFEVTDCQKDNCGYDLLVKNSKQTLKVEVKGTAFNEQHFFISRNERAKSADPLWRLAVVVNALSIPELEIFNAEEMENRFNFKPLCWECTQFQK